MQITNLHSFLEDYFEAHECSIVHNYDGVMTVQLTEEMDRTLMNRPFYWQYIKSTGHPGDPMKLVLITNPNKREEEGEWVHFGSPRLQQIFNHLKEKSNNIKLFQQLNVTANTPLHPWLVINIKINYNGKQNKNELFSIGLNLVNGSVNTKMMESLDAIPLRTTISDYCYSISPLIKLDSGFKRIETMLDQYLDNQTHQWAAESVTTLHEEIELVKHFYQHLSDSDQLENEISDLTKRFTPSITYHIVNGGIVYLKQ